MNLPSHELITKPQAWQACLTRLQSEPRIAIDLEANSMYAYQEQVCLIQISIPQQDYIVDPLAPLDLGGLGAILARPDIEKVFHAAEYDLILLKREFQWQLNNLFDTMWAARILGYERYGLANMLGDLFQVKLNKRYQKSNWCKRPLSSSQLTYAQLDTHYLLALRDLLSNQLEAANRMVEAQEIFAEQTLVEPSNNEFDPDSFWSLNGAHELTAQKQAVLKALNIYRDQEARRRDQPHFKILTNKTLLQLARKMPSDFDELGQVFGMTRGQMRRYGRRILEVIAANRNAPAPEQPPSPKRPPDSVLNRYEKLHHWRKIRARKRGVESDVIVSRHVLWTIAETNPRNRNELQELDVLGEWRYQTYSSEILDVIQNT